MTPSGRPPSRSRFYSISSSTRGDLRAQIAAELPAGFTLDKLRGNLRLKLFLDAFNELSSAHIENGAFFRSLDALKDEIGDFDYAITSRTSDGLPKRSEELQFYEIDRFDSHHVDAVLAKHGVKLSGRFADDIRYLLSRPFFLQLVAKELVEVPANANPRDLFASFIANVQKAFSERFETDLVLLPIFAKVAYRAIEAESEAFPLGWLSDLIATQTPDAAAFSASEVINWLIAREVLVPYTGGRASFVHQSITEYCAATELARRSRNDTLLLRDTIASKKWDQCLFLALALMEPVTAETVLKEAIEADFNFAVNAVRYAEEGQSAAVARLLNAVNSRTKDVDPQRLFGLWLYRLPVGPEHVELLRQLIPVGNAIGGEAVKLIADVLGAQFKPELLDLLEAHADDYNFAVNGIAHALAALIEEDDLPRLIAIAETWLAKGDDDAPAPIGDLMAMFEPEALIRAAQSATGMITPGMADILARGLEKRSDDDPFALLADLLLAHPEKATSSFSLAIQRNEDTVDVTRYRRLDYRHVEAIWSARFCEVLWDSALSRVCRLRPDLKSHVDKMAEAHEGIEAIALRYCADTASETVFASLEQLLQFDDATLKNQPFDFFSLSQLDWRGREALFMQSLVRDLGCAEHCSEIEPMSQP